MRCFAGLKRCATERFCWETGCVLLAAGSQCKQNVARSLPSCVTAALSHQHLCLQALDKRDKDLREKLGSVRDNSSELNSLQEQAEKVTVLWLTGLMAALPTAGCWL